MVEYNKTKTNIFSNTLTPVWTLLTTTFNKTLISVTNKKFSVNDTHNPERNELNVVNDIEKWCVKGSVQKEKILSVKVGLKISY